MNEDRGYELPQGFRVTESKTAPLPVDSTGAPIVVECPAKDCTSIDLEVTEGAGSKTWIVTCGNGHMAFMHRKDKE